MAVAALVAWHEAHAEARKRAADAHIPAHARLETYSVLTRLPPPHRLDPHVTSDLLTSWFPAKVTIVPPARLSREIVDRCRGAGITGGAVYDALVALTAAESGRALVTRDTRALPTYKALDVEVEFMK